MCILTRPRQAVEAREGLDPLHPRLRPIRSSELTLPTRSVDWVEARALHHSSGMGGTSGSPADGFPYSMMSRMSTTRCEPEP